MNLYKVPLADPNWRKRSVVEWKHKRIWDKAAQSIKIINTVGICICVYLWICVAFNAF